jgi:hypothetical protein
LETISAAQFTPHGMQVGMTDTTDTTDLPAPLAKTTIGDVRQLAGQGPARSTENAATINE